MLFTKSFITWSPEETIALGRQFGNLLRPNDVVALCGPLGSGKTCFSKGVAVGLGVNSMDEIVSPTFILIQELQGRIPFFHIDLYRIEKREEIENLGLEEYWERGGVCLVEWAERAESLLPSGTLTVSFEVKEENQRSLHFGSSESHDIIKRLCL